MSDLFGCSKGYRGARFGARVSSGRPGGKPPNATVALRLEGEILVAGGRINEAVGPIQASVSLAQELGMARDIWMGSLALGKALIRLGQDNAAESALKTSAETIETIATALRTDALIQSFRNAVPVQDVFQTLGQRQSARDRSTPS